jgi:hypothetical protein
MPNNKLTKKPSEILSELKQPFPANVLHWRLGATNKRKIDPPTKGIPLAYIDARDVMKRLDDVLGIEGWQCNYNESSSNIMICNLGIKIGDDWIWKADGAGLTDVEGEKGALSDSLKRAAVRHGIGRYLYYLKAQWVDLDQQGKFTIPALPKWATAEDKEPTIKTPEKQNE